MPLYGTLKSMPLPDLLQWLGTTQRTGTLQIELTKVSKSIHIRDGQIVGCSSTDPTQRLGHFLLSRGKITEEHLRTALSTQESSGEHLGKILVGMNVITESELAAQLEDKAEETIFSMFDWGDAVFRFHEELQLEAHVFPVSLRVEDVLLRGLKRYDEMHEIRAVFNDPGIVPGLTDVEPPAEIFGNRMARTLFEAIDGERTVAEILLHVHGSEYVVTRFLFELYRNGIVRIVGIKPVMMGLDPRHEDDDALAALPIVPEPSTPAVPTAAPAETSPPERATQRPAPPTEVIAADAAFEIVPPSVQIPLVPEAPAPTTARTPPPPLAALPDPGEDLFADWNPEIDLPATTPARPPEHPAPSAHALSPPLSAQPAATAKVEPPRTQPAANPVTSTAVEALEKPDAHQLHLRLEAARKFLAASEYESALEILDQLYRQFPSDQSLRRLNAEAEAAFIEKAYRHFLPPHKIPTLTRPVALLESETLSPSEFFLLSRIDGSWNVKSIIQIAPLREVDALRTLKRMREDGVIELHEPATGQN